MNHTKLNFRFREYTFNGLGKAGKIIDGSNKNVFPIPFIPAFFFAGVDLLLSIAASETKKVSFSGSDD